MEVPLQLLLQGLLSALQTVHCRGLLCRLVSSLLPHRPALMSAVYAWGTCRTRHCSSSCWKHHAKEETICHCFPALYSSVVLCRCQTLIQSEKSEGARGHGFLTIESIQLMNLNSAAGRKQIMHLTWHLNTVCRNPTWCLRQRRRSSRSC